MEKRFVYLAMSLGLAVAAPSFSSSPSPPQIPLVAGAWEANGNAAFLAKEAFPNGILQVTSESEKGFVALKDGHFDNGTIEFDIKPIGEEFPGIRFHQKDGNTADMLYFRVSPDCPAAQDCLQYVPIIKGRVLWDMYPQYQAPAPFRENEWNHIRLVVSGKRMNVYVNRQAEPSLRIAHLEGNEGTGTIALEGTAYYANLTLAPGVTDGLSPEAPPDPAATDHRYLLRWRRSNPITMTSTAHLGLSSMPPLSAHWQEVAADYGGLVNLSRYNVPIPKGTPPKVIWLRTTLHSKRNQLRRVSVGWLREIWVFANGERVFSGKNLYNVKGERRSPDGRLSLENGGFDLPLHKGKNEIVVAIDDNTPDMRGFYGWGFMMRLDSGVEMEPAGLNDTK